MPAIQSAFLQFLTVGEVPGMYGTLSPDTVFIILAGIFSLSLLLIFGKEIKSSMRRRRVVSGAQSLGHTPVVTPISNKPAPIHPKNEPVMSIVIKRPRYFAGTPIPVLKLNLKDKKLPVLYIPSLRPLGHKLAVVGRKLGVLIRRAIVAEYDSLKTIFGFLWVSTVIVSGQIWEFARPRIRRMGSWIGKRIRRNDLVAEILEVAEEVWRSFAPSRRKVEKS